MFSVFIVLLSFSSSLARGRTKCLFLNEEPCMVRSTLIDLNPVELKYYPLVISLNKCTESCNVLSRKICVPKETKYIHFKAFHMITNKNEAKAMAEHISCGFKFKFNSAGCNSNQKWNDKTCQCECKNYCACIKDYSWNPTTCICQNDKCLKSTSVTECDGIISVMHIL